ncbi:MAG TPA: ABC transporter ATP-binding protein [Solirubrobacteraceae bacterium]|nr:ABC transporter ATP-binding protein [Solirubrobacteraceae bacterium]
MAGGAVSLSALAKQFGDFVAVAGIDLDIPSGEFFSMLGPSGCGKTTTLRMIGGFEKPTSGRILLDGVDVTETSAHRRPVNTVFQSYALFPHLNVFDNVAFGLRRARVDKTNVRRRVATALELVGLTGREHSKPIQLSGGQQQRVALARALILEPAVLLLDEPLGALDAKLRKNLQTELKALQKTVGITFIYVTHDQEEALTMSDRIAVMCDGRVDQLGAPREVYEEPSTVFVADFLGVANLLPAKVVDSNGNGGCRVRLGETELDAGRGDTATRGDAMLVVRPERVFLEEHGSAGPNRVPGMVERVVYLGPAVQVVVRLAAGGTIQALVQGTSDELRWRQGTPVHAHLPGDALRVLTSREPEIAPAGDDQEEKR